MIEEELVKRADEYVNAQVFTDVYSTSRKAELACFWAKGYHAGATENGVVCHDLRKNPKDVPLIEDRYLCILDYGRTHSKPVVLMYADDRLGHFVWVADDDDIYDGCVSKWAEIPNFEEEVVKL